MGLEIIADGTGNLFPSPHSVHIDIVNIDRLVSETPSVPMAGTESGHYTSKLQEPGYPINY